MRRILAVLVLFLVLIAAGPPVGATPRGSLPLEESGFDVNAKAALLLDPESGVYLFAKNEQERLPPASVTKVMTMLLIAEAIDSGRVKLDEPILASATAAGTGGSQVYLKEGERFPLEQMLIAIAVESANDASTAVAEHLYSTEEDFVRIMNTRAQQLGMGNTHFANAHGLPDPGHYMSTTDIGVVSRELVHKHPRILKYTSIWTYTLRPGVTELRNTNDLIRLYRGADGLKTGYTEEAGWCLVSTAKRGTMRLLSVIMGAASNEDRLRETKRLLDYGFRNFERRLVARKGQDLGRVSVRDAWPAKLRVKAPADIATVVPRGKARLTTTRLAPKPGVHAPLAKGAILADLEILQAGRVISRLPVQADRRIGRASFVVLGWRALLRWVAGWFHQVSPAPA